LHWSRAQIWSWHWYQWWDKFVVLVSWSCKITCNQLNFAFLLGVTCMHQEMSKRDRPFLWNGFKCEMASRSVTSHLSIYCSPISFGWSSLKNFYKVVMQILQLRGWFCVCVDIYNIQYIYIIIRILSDTFPVSGKVWSHDKNNSEEKLPCFVRGCKGFAKLWVPPEIL
jgi:hypothetical protein